jgi:predicted small integral membrane protein
MIMMRLAKTAIVAALAAFALIVAYNNVVDYDSNYQFVRHVLSMDTIFPDSALRSRAIDSETVWRAAYALIIATEAATGVLLALGAAASLVRLRSPAKTFNRAKLLAVAGLTLGFCLWFFGFIVVGGEYFAMWQSNTWNGVEGAFRFVTMILGGLIFLSLPDGELT